MVCKKSLVSLLVVLCALLCCVCFADSRSASFLPDTLLRQISTEGPGVPVVVFNPLSWERTDGVEVESPFPGQCVNIKITDSSGATYPGRTLGDRLIFTARSVPALGYKVFWVSKSDAPVPSSIKCTSTWVANEFFQVEVDPRRGVITSIYDKVNKRQIVAPLAKAAQLRLINGTRTHDATTGTMTVMMDSGPARGLIILDNSLDGQSMVQELILREGVPRVDIRVTSCWCSPLPQSGAPAEVRVDFPTRLANPKPSNGGIEEAENGALIPGLRWIDVSDSDYGVSLLASGAYSCGSYKGLVSAVLRRQGDEGVWQANYSITTHKGDSASGRAFERAFEVANPLCASVASSRKGILPSAMSLLTYQQPSVIGVLAAGSGESPTLKFYEIRGQYTSVPVSVGVDGITLTRVDRAGRPSRNAAPITGRSFTLNIADNDSTAYAFSWPTTVEAASTQ